MKKLLSVLFVVLTSILSSVGQWYYGDENYTGPHSGYYLTDTMEAAIAGTTANYNPYPDFGFGPPVLAQDGLGFELYGISGENYQGQSLWTDGFLKFDNGESWNMYPWGFVPNTEMASKLTNYFVSVLALGQAIGILPTSVTVTNFVTNNVTVYTTNYIEAVIEPAKSKRGKGRGK